MANVRKVTHRSGRTAWQATVQPAGGKRRSKNFDRKGAADAWVKANDGASANGSATMTLLELARSHNRWFEGVVRAGDRSQRTLDGYESHLEVHVESDKTFAKTRLSALDTPAIQGFLDGAIERTGSTETARRLKKSLSAWCAHGRRKGWLKIDPVDGAKIVEKRRRRADSRVEIPPKDALGRLLGAADTGPNPERDTAVVSLLMFAGLRISEMLGMADEAITIPRRGANGSPSVFVRERLCSRHTVLGDVKSDDGLRDVPIGPAVVAALRAWRVARGASLVFLIGSARKPGRLFPAPPGRRFGQLWSYQDFMRLCWRPMLLRAGLATFVPDKLGVKRIAVAFGPHTLRHVYASIQIENSVTPKRLQQLLGHATLAMTMDLYGHLWSDPAGDQAMAAAAERSVPKIAVGDA